MSTENPNPSSELPHELTLQYQIRDGVQSIAQVVHESMGSMRVQIHQDGSLSQQWVVSELAEAKKFQAHVIVQMETLTASLEAMFQLIPDESQKELVRTVIAGLQQTAKNIKAAAPKLVESPIIMP